MAMQMVNAMGTDGQPDRTGMVHRGYDPPADHRGAAPDGGTGGCGDSESDACSEMIPTTANAVINAPTAPSDEGAVMRTA